MLTSKLNEKISKKNSFNPKRTKTIEFKHLECSYDPKDADYTLILSLKLLV